MHIGVCIDICVVCIYKGVYTYTYIAYIPVSFMHSAHACVRVRRVHAYLGFEV